MKPALVCDSFHPASRANSQVEAGHEHAELHRVMRSQSFAVSSMLVIPLLLVGQTAVPDQTPSNGTPTAAPPQASAPPPIPQPPPFDRPVSWKLLLPNLVNDQERIWSFPARLVQGQNWIPTAAVLGTTAGLIALDPTEASYFRSSSSFHAFNNIFTG